jgi:2-polyprenyl-6-methoxyphenol hydroxylase-like FAD-dependent oxidoreductase
MAAENYRRDGVVLIGDTFQTTCPAAGNGVTRALTDATQLCNVHVPRWLKTAGMDTGKIAQFYDDPVKRACDAHVIEVANYHRSLSVERGAMWRARRWRAFIRPLVPAWVDASIDRLAKLGEITSVFGLRRAALAKPASPIAQHLQPRDSF